MSLGGVLNGFEADVAFGPVWRWLQERQEFLIKVTEGGRAIASQSLESLAFKALKVCARLSP